MLSAHHDVIMVVNQVELSDLTYLLECARRDTGVPGKGDLFYKLWVLGDGNDGFDADRATLWYTSGHGDATLRPNEEPLPWLVKTFQERRTWFATYLAYYRIFVFHILWFHVLLALAFAQDPDDSGDSFQNRCSLLPVSHTQLTHAVHLISQHVLAGERRCTPTVITFQPLPMLWFALCML